MVNYQSTVSYLKFRHSLVLQKENTEKHKEKSQQIMSKGFLVLNYMH